MWGSYFYSIRKVWKRCFWIASRNWSSSGGSFWRGRVVKVTCCTWFCQGSVSCRKALMWRRIQKNRLWSKKLRSARWFLKGSSAMKFAKLWNCKVKLKVINRFCHRFLKKKKRNARKNDPRSLTQIRLQMRNLNRNLKANQWLKNLKTKEIWPPKMWIRFQSFFTNMMLKWYQRISHVSPWKSTRNSSNFFQTIPWFSWKQNIN